MLISSVALQHVRPSLFFGSRLVVNFQQKKGDKSTLKATGIIHIGCEFMLVITKSICFRHRWLGPICTVTTSARYLPAFQSNVPKHDFLESPPAYISHPDNRFACASVIFNRVTGDTFWTGKLIDCITKLLTERQIERQTER